MSVSYLFSAFLVCISYINSNSKKQKIQKSKNDIELIYSEPVKIKILLIRTFFVSFVFFYLNIYFLFFIFSQEELLQGN